MSEPTAPYHTRNGNGKHAYAIDVFSAGAEIEVQYRTAAEVLFAAVMREPHLFAACAHKMHAAWWRQTRYDKAAQAVFEQFYSPSKSYSAYTVCKPGGDVLEKDLFEIQGRHADTDLNAALDFFLPIYRQWVIHRAAQYAQSGIAQGIEAERIKDEQDRFIADCHAYPTEAASVDVWFEDWFERKMQGLEIDYPCKPSLNTVINARLNIGYEPGCYYLIAARSGMGKTTYILNDILRWVKEGSRGVFVTLDMNVRMTKIKLIGIITGYTHDDDWTVLTDTQRQQISDAKKYVDEMPVVWLDKTNNINEVISTCYGEHYKAPIRYLVIDFIQKIVDTKIENRALAIGSINTKLKLLANTLNIPIIALAQISRAVELRGGSRRPQLSDLKDSGSLEEDADVVTFLYRPEYYNIIEDENGRSLKGKAEIIFAKQRMRKVDSVYVDFSGVRGFSDPEYHEQGKTVPAFPVVDFSQARPDLDKEDIPF